MCSNIRCRDINTKPVSQHLLATTSTRYNFTKRAKYTKLKLPAAIMLGKLQTYAYPWRNIQSNHATTGSTAPQYILVAYQEFMDCLYQKKQSCDGWIDSATALYWLLTKSSWTIYVRKQVIKRIERYQMGIESTFQPKKIWLILTPQILNQKVWQTFGMRDLAWQSFGMRDQVGLLSKKTGQHNR